MDNMIEIEGKTVDEAIEKACARFGVPREKLSIDIISEGTSGFLGLGSKKAKILAGLLTLDIVDETSLTPPKVAREEKPVQPAVTEKETEIVRPPLRAGRGSEPTSPPPAVQTPVMQTPAAQEKRPEPKSEDGEAIGLKAKEILNELLSRMSIPSPIKMEETDEAVILNIQGDGDGLLIGKRGQNLDALQHIVNKAVNKVTNSKKMIVVDTEAYRKRREESLVTLAERLGQKVKKTRKTVTVTNMNAHDRRIIHMTLQGDAALLTKSRGEGEYRKIIIMPARRERDPERPRNNVATD